MNTFTAVVKFISIPDIRYAGDNQTAVIKPTIELLAPYGSGDTFTISSVAWGKVAEQLSKMDDGLIAFVTGQLNVLKVDRDGFKESIASFKITRIITTLDRMVDFNELSVLGNVGQDVDVRYFDSGKNKSGFSLAVRRSREETDWFPIELWGDTAKIAEKYVEKGSKVGVVGHLKLDSWTDKNTGEVRTKPVIVGDRITLAGRNQDQSVGETTQYEYQHEPLAKSQKAPSSSTIAQSRHDTQGDEPDFDDIPF